MGVRGAPAPLSSDGTMTRHTRRGFCGLPTNHLHLLPESCLPGPHPHFCFLRSLPGDSARTQALSQDTLLRKFQLRCLGKPSQQDWRMRKARCLPSFQRLPQLSSRHPCSTCCSPSERGVVPWTCWHFPPSVTRAMFSAWSTLPFVFLISGVHITPEFKTQRKYCFPAVSADPTHPYSYILGWETNPSFL